MTGLICEAAQVGAATLINRSVGTGDQRTAVPTRPHFYPHTPARNKGRCGSQALDGELLANSRSTGQPGEAGLGHADLIRGLGFGFPQRSCAGHSLAAGNRLWAAAAGRRAALRHQPSPLPPARDELSHLCPPAGRARPPVKDPIAL